VFVHPEKYAGQSVADKIRAVRRLMSERKADCLLVNALDEIAWLFNIRACDVEYNLTCTAYAAIEAQKTILFVDKEKVSNAAYEYFMQHKITLKNYADFEIYLKNNDKQTIWFDEAAMNASIYRYLKPDYIKERSTSPIQRLKSLNNDTQTAGIRLAMRKDGAALVRFLMWLEQSLQSGEPLTEISVAEQLHAFRQEQELFFGDSFATIAGYAEHGAIVHYHAAPATNAPLLPHSLLLLDSGAHYWHGTTDITRTLALGTPTEQQRRDFTLVLKGHIALAQAVFPTGTCGFLLDVLARKALWDAGLNYGHGTGHGVGFFSCVHEGLHNIRPKGAAVPLEAGMLLSNEPGIYRAGEYGIRTENLMLVKNADKAGFLGFETVSLCPFDKHLIDFSLLNDEENKWLQQYHKKIEKELSEFLTEEERKWLKRVNE
jgi:Xaa-Pro aminopeptidase